MNEQEKPVARKNKNTVVTFRIFQAIFFGIFALGLSGLVGDFSEIIKLPFSTFNITTTVFGGIGASITGILAKQCEKW